MARNRNRAQAGLYAGNATSGAQQAQRLNQQATAGRSGQANYEFATELGTAGAAGAGYASSGAQAARQKNQKAMQNAARKAGK